MMPQEACIAVREKARKKMSQKAISNNIDESQNKAANDKIRKYRAQAMCAVVVSKTSCNDRNHPMLRGVIAPHQDFFLFLQKS
jgi:hypothetical protein